MSRVAGEGRNGRGLWAGRALIARAVHTPLGRRLTLPRYEGIATGAAPEDYGADYGKDKAVPSLVQRAGKARCTTQQEASR
jgi:hypothetical protein